MSGFIGIVNLDGRPVDRELLARMTSTLEFRGPDATQIWAKGDVGFGHTLLRTTDEAANEHQPFSIDTQTWIVADARIDARSTLVKKLLAQGREVAVTQPDVELILHAYHVWGEACVDHMIGDFAFAIWDGVRSQLFCARDHLGIRPLFYAHVGTTVIVSNTLNCVRDHPAVSTRLNDLAIADFLLFGFNQEKDNTCFADIQRLAPAHTARWGSAGFHKCCYWTLPIEEPIYFRRLDDYTDRFSELLGSAVDDRIRTDQISVLMSGGLDSTTLAAFALPRLSARSGVGSLKAFTSLLGPTDEEGNFAGLTAAHLGIPIEYEDVLAGLPSTSGEPMAPRLPEPRSSDIETLRMRQRWQRLARHSRVAFYGEGPDNALEFEWKPYLRYLAGRREFWQMAKDLALHMVLHRRLPLLSTLPAMAALRWSERTAEPPFNRLDWLNTDLSSRLDLPGRWAQWQRGLAQVHPVRPNGHASFGLANWQHLFEEHDPAITGVAVEVRHPFLDLRLLEFLLRVPALPWCRRKFLMRRGARGRLPQEVLRRPKTPVVGDPWADRMRTEERPPIELSNAAGAYVDLKRLQACSPLQHVDALWLYDRVKVLSEWLALPLPTLMCCNRDSL